MKIYITKYALTRGIISADTSDISGDMAVVGGEGGRLSMYFHKGEWFLSMEDAVEDAKKRTTRKIASLERSIEKLRKASWTESNPL